jgi:hypothetical protein
MEEIERLAEDFLARIPGYVWDGESLPVPIDEIADTHIGLLVRDVEDLGNAPGAPELDDGQTLSGLLLPARGEIWVNAEEARQWPARRRFTTSGASATSSGCATCSAPQAPRWEDGCTR